MMEMFVVSFLCEVVAAGTILQTFESYQCKCLNLLTEVTCIQSNTLNGYQSLTVFYQQLGAINVDREGDITLLFRRMERNIVSQLTGLTIVYV